MTTQENCRKLFDLTGRVAVITGGQAGLGWDIAEAFASSGCHVILTSRKEEQAHKAAQRLESSYSVEALGLRLEQTEHASVRQMAQSALDWKGRIDILVNNAGGGSGVNECDFLKRDPNHIQRMIDVNLTGTIFCCQAVSQGMVQAGQGSIINIASVAALVGRNRAMYIDNNKMQQPVEYAAAKAGVLGLTRDLAAYLAPHGIRVNAISPGGFDKGDLPALSAPMQPRHHWGAWVPWALTSKALPCSLPAAHRTM